MMDFKGTWKTRSGHMATVKDWENGVWFGEIIDDNGNDIWSGWNTEGEFVSIYSDKVKGRKPQWDLMERLSERWSKERSGE